MKALEHEYAIRMRLSEQISYGAIAKRLKVSKSTLSRWLRDVPLTEEITTKLRQEAWKKTEIKRERFLQTMREKREKNEHTVYEVQKAKFAQISDQALFIAGLLVYEAEGDKKSRYEIAFTNTDPRMLLFFARWAQKFLRIPKDKFRAQLHLYEGMDIAAEEEFWKSQLELTQKQLWKTQIRPLRPNSFSYRNASRHGTCKLYVGSGPKKTELRLSIRAFFDTYREHLRV